MFDRFSLKIRLWLSLKLSTLDFLYCWCLYFVLRTLNNILLWVMRLRIYILILNNNLMARWWMLLNFQTLRVLIILTWLNGIWSFILSNCCSFICLKINNWIGPFRWVCNSSLFESITEIWSTRNTAYIPIRLTNSKSILKRFLLLILSLKLLFRAKSFLWLRISLM